MGDRFAQLYQTKCKPLQNAWYMIAYHIQAEQSQYTSLYNLINEHSCLVPSVLCTYYNVMARAGNPGYEH